MGMEQHRGIVVRRSRAEWLGLVREWQRSGWSVRAFAQAHGISPARLAWWKWQLGRREESARPRLVAVDVVDDRAVAEGSAADGWELTTADGARLQVRGRLAGDDLRTVIELLTTRRRR